MKHLFLLATAATALVSVPANAATTFTINGTGSSITTTNGAGFCVGCNVDATKSAYVTNNSTFTLNNVGDSQTFNFASLLFSGVGVGSASVNAVLAFTAPSSSGVATGNANYFSFGGIFTGGTLTWSNPASPIIAADGTRYSVSFNDLAGITVGSRVNSTVTVRLLAAAVPEPATWAMMLVGFGMVAGAARYRRRSTTATYA